MIYLSNYDLAIPGSPTKATLRSPLIIKPSSLSKVQPEIIYNSKAFLTSSKP